MYKLNRHRQFYSRRTPRALYDRTLLVKFSLSIYIILASHVSGGQVTQVASRP